MGHHTRDKAKRLFMSPKAEEGLEHSRNSGSSELFVTGQKVFSQALQFFWTYGC